MVKINLEKQRVVTKDQEIERLLFLDCVKELSNIIDIAFMSQNVCLCFKIVLLFLCYSLSTFISYGKAVGEQMFSLLTTPYLFLSDH